MVFRGHQQSVSFSTFVLVFSLTCQSVRNTCVREKRKAGRESFRYSLSIAISVLQKTAAISDTHTKDTGCQWSFNGQVYAVHLWFIC